MGKGRGGKGANWEAERYRKGVQDRERK